jgi:hypothetical protein
MTCIVFSSSFISSDNFSVIVSLNDLKSNGSTLLQLSVDVATAPPNLQPGNRIDWQEVTTIAVAAGIVVSYFGSVFDVAFLLTAGIMCCNRLLLLHRPAPQRYEGADPAINTNALRGSLIFLL